MRKTISLVLILSLIFLLLVGCGQKKNEPSTSPSASQSGVNETLKTGLAVITSIGKSKDAGEEDGTAEVDSTIVAVTVDKDGKIAACSIDAVQSVIKFSDKGKLITPLDTVFKTKQELGKDYGMGKVSSIGKEWGEQAKSFAQYVVGKTVAEIKGIAVDEEGSPTGTDLTSSVTISIGDFVQGIEKAVSTAKDLGAKSGDKLGLGIKTTMTKSTDAGDKDGIAQAYSNYAVTTFNSEGKITSCIIDASQTNVTFTKAGKITSDLTQAPKTKNELGTSYGMIKASSIGKEWFEEAEALAKYVVGKSISEVKGISVSQEGTPTDAELKSSVTISILDYIEVIEKSQTNSK